jgi:hypothetical protein
LYNGVCDNANCAISDTAFEQAARDLAGLPGNRDVRPAGGVEAQNDVIDVLRRDQGRRQLDRLGRGTDLTEHDLVHMVVAMERRRRNDGVRIDLRDEERRQRVDPGPAAFLGIGYVVEAMVDDHERVKPSANEQHTEARRPRPASHALIAFAFRHAFEQATGDTMSFDWNAASILIALSYPALHGGQADARLAAVRKRE